ncbi:MAG: MauE/DoxX family redox-associated membrane protein [Micromonosporaceae bacterium]
MVLRIILGAVFLGMAVGQVVSWREMPEILAAYQAAPAPMLLPLAVALLVGEAVTGVWFLARPRAQSLTPVWVYTAVSLVWAALGVQAYLRGLDVANCGCFGVYLTQRLSLFVLAQDALLLGYAALLIRSGLHARQSSTQRGSTQRGSTPRSATTREVVPQVEENR